MQKKKLLLVTYGNRDHGSTRIRALNHFERLQDQFDVTWVPRTGLQPGNGLIDKIFFAIHKRYCQARQLVYFMYGSFDVVFIQVSFVSGFWLRSLKKRGAKIIYDFDDAVYSYSGEKFETMMKYCDKLVVATPYLKDYVSRFKVPCEVVYSPVDTDVIKPHVSTKASPVIGWIGSPWTAKYLHDLAPVFRQLACEFRFRLLVVGADLKLEGVETECHPWSEKQEKKALLETDIGIMPVRDDEWSRMKGGYKLFLYMAAGLPIVATPSGINREIVRDGVNGFAADSIDKWLDALRTLCNDEALRKRMGTEGRKDAESKYSYSVCTPLLCSCISG